MKCLYNLSEVKPFLTEHPRRIILIGFAACYKTTVGKLLSTKFNYAFVDTDAEIERLENMSVQQIFDTYGEAYFRRKESELLGTLTACDTVVSCGGGSVLADGFDEFTRDCTVIWLTASADTVKSRLGGVARPLFDGLTVEQLAERIAERTPLYSRHACITFHTDNKTPEQVAEEIYKWIKKTS